MSRTSNLLVVLLSLACLLLPAVASAQGSAADVAAARELFKQAAELSKQGKWEEARTKLERSIQLKRAPITHFSLGVAQQKTGQLVEALESFRAFLISPEERATDKYRAPANKAVGELEKQVARVLIKVEPSDVQGMKLAIDGADVPLAALAQPRLVNPGSHQVEVTAPGYHAARDSFEVAEGGSTEVSLTLTEAPEDAAPEQTAGSDTAPSAPAETEPAVGLVPGIALAAVGVAALGAGIGVGFVGVNEAKKAPTSDGDEAKAARTKGYVGDTLAAVGGAAAGVGLILIIVHVVTGGEQEPATTAGARAPAVTVRPWVGGVEVRF